MEFQRIAKRDKKVFLSDQCKEIEEYNRMGKTRDLFKIRDTGGIFHAKMVKKKGQKPYGPNRRYYEVARIHRRTIQKNILMTQITMMV